MNDIQSDDDLFSCNDTEDEYLPNSSLDSSSSTQSAVLKMERKVKTRKRQRNVEDWQKIKNKQRKNTGQEFISSSGRKIPAKTLRDGCPTKCRMKCQNKISVQVRRKIFDLFYNLGNRERQWDFILKGVKVIDKKVTKISSGESRRKSSREYFLNLNTVAEQYSTRVCQKMFLDTLAISNQVVDTALAKNLDGGKDNRGKYIRPVNELKQASKTYVMAHINSFPAIESHYLRAKTTKLYLDADLTISKMYRLYITWIKDKNIKTEMVTGRQYRDIFNSYFNISFFKPKKDQCSVCTSFANKSSIEQEDEKKKYEEHLEFKLEARRLKDIGKAAAIINPAIVTACFDFEKVLQIPYADASIFYYKRKLAVHNFTVYNMASREGYCYLWDEVTAKQGACEVASCLYKFILTEISKNKTVKFCFWSDNCPGQNKNKILFTFYSWVSSFTN